MEDERERLVRAAGGVVVRGPHVLVVHRPGHDDWTLPKGKVEPGESDEDAALREVWEETGFRCELRAELPATHYTDAQRRPKRVRWWRMEPVAGAFTSNDEVDEVQWLTREEAAELLSYRSDRALVDAL